MHASLTMAGVPALRVAKALMILCVAASSFSVMGAENETWLGLPLSHGARTYAFKPWPAIQLDNVKVQTAQLIEISRAWVTPDYADWILQRTTRNVRVVAEEITARPASLARLGVMDGPSSRVVTRMTFNRLKLRFGAETLELPAGTMEFAPDGSLAHIRISLEDRVNLDMTPKNGELGVLVQATSGFTWSALPAFKFESVVAQGTISDDKIVLDKIGANTDGGAVSGTLSLSGNGKFELDGNLKLVGVRAHDLLDRLYPRHTVDGMLGADFRLTASGDTFETLGTALAVSGSYSLKAGSIDRFGLLEGLRKSSPGVAGGGMVRFDSISGKFSSVKDKQGNVSFQGLDAGALRSSGAFSVKPDGSLAGSVNGTLQSPGGETTVRTLQLSGKVNAPILSVRE